jgi:hypothetical protein
MEKHYTLILNVFMLVQGETDIKHTVPKIVFILALSFYVYIRIDGHESRVLDTYKTHTSSIL